MQSLKVFSEEDELLAIKLYNDRIPIKEIAKIFGYKSKDIIYKILKKHNVPKRRSIRKRIISSVDKGNIKEDYILGKSLKHISKKYNTPIYLISNILDEQRIVKRQTNQIYKVDDTYFDVIDNQNKAYVLGFIFADGTINKKCTCLSITLHEKDIDILQKIKKELRTDANIKPVLNKTNKHHVRLNICSTLICRALEKLGCRRNKTFDLKMPNIKEDLRSHFIRGFMDGDGCICIISRKTKKYFSLSFTGTLDMMESLKSIFGIDNKIYFFRNAYALHIGKRIDVIRIVRWLYKDCDLFLQRKYNKYIEMQEYLTEVS